MLSSLQLFATCAALAFRLPKKIRRGEWINENVMIPATVGAAEPGPLDLGRVPPMEGLLDLINQSHVRTFTLKKSARTGGTLLCFADLLYTIAENPVPVLWVDPSRASGRQLFRRELEPFLLECKPVAALAIQDKEHWTASQCFFRNGAFLKIAGAGSPNELAGFNACRVYINESGKVHHTTKGEAPAHLLAEARVKLFPHTSKIIEQSTPTDEFGAITTRHAKGTQRVCYVPCPHCSAKRAAELGKPPVILPEKAEAGRSLLSYDHTLAGWQRVSFFSEENTVPFQEDGTPLPPGETRHERTGFFRFDHCRISEEHETEPGKMETVNLGWDFDRVEQETYYECANGCRIEFSDLYWMLRRYWWRATNTKATRSHESAHWWAGFSPMERWGSIAKRYVLALGDPGAMHDLWNNYFGLEFKSVATEVDETDIEKLKAASPHYIQGTIPSGSKAGGFRPVCLTMTVDVQKQGSDAPFWWVIMAWGIAWDLPDWPTVGVLVDYGPAQSWTQIEELAAIIERLPIPGSKHAPGFNQYLWRDPADEKTHAFRVLSGLVDSGDQAQSEADVYEFCRRNNDIFQPSKGGGRTHCRGNVLYESLVDDKRLKLLWYWSDLFCQILYRRIIKDRKKLRWLPADLDPEFIDQLTDEHTVTKNGKLVWEARRGRNHLGDCMKMQEVLSGTIEEELDKMRVARMREIESAAVDTAK